MTGLRGAVPEAHSRQADEEVDVAICGGGLAALTLARQITRAYPDLSVALIERQARPLPDATHKVGESTVLAGAHYLEKHLGLGEYLEKNHIKKLGLRFFFPEATPGDFASRPELGRARSLPGVSEWQIDRGRFERDLREMVEGAGVWLIEGASVRAIHLDEKTTHRVVYETTGKRDPGANQAHELRCRWVIDATGRRRFLQKQLGLSRKEGIPYSAAWFRVEGRIDVSDFVPFEDRSWHERVEGQQADGQPSGRSSSTVHLMGKGYWVWLIPLSSGHTSVGIVVLEEEQAWDELQTQERAFAWLEKHEPYVHRECASRRVLDFRVMRHFSYSAERVISGDRWATIGEAGTFADPFLSPGTDSIAFLNHVVVEAIGRDRAGGDLHATVDWLDGEFRDWSDNVTHAIQMGYSHFDDALPGATKILWDLALGFGFSVPLFTTFLGRPGFSNDPHAMPGEETLARAQEVKALTIPLIQLLQDWEAIDARRLSYRFIDYFEVPAIREMAERAASGKNTLGDLYDQAAPALVDLAHALFLLAVQDTMPGHLPQLEGRSLNPWAMSLRPDAWEQDGLFEPRSSADGAHAIASVLGERMQPRD